MRTPAYPLFTLLALGLQAFAAPADETIALEARLKETTLSSPAGAELMLKLVERSWQDEQVFGLIRSAGKFSRAQADHPRRAEITLKLIDGYAATARHEDVITTGRQFLELFPRHALSNNVRDRVATALERTGRGTAAATERAEIWRSRATVDDGIAALRLWMAANTAPGFQHATEFAGELVAKLPVSPLLTDVGFQSLEAASRAEQWAEGLKIAKALTSRKAPMNARRQSDLAFRSGQFEARLGQFENAIQSFRKAMGSGSAVVHRSLIAAMIASTKANPADIEAEARRYLAAHPGADDRHEPLIAAAHAAADSKDRARAVALAEDVILNHEKPADLPQALVSWHGEDPQRAEQGLLKLIGKNPPSVARLRAVLVLNVYRDQLKDIPKARAMAHEFLAKSPADDSSGEEVLKFLYDSAPTPEAFRDDLKRVSASARAFPQLGGFQDHLWNPAPTDKNREREWLAAKNAHQNDPVTKLWRQTREDGGQAAQACQKLLQAAPSPDNRLRLLARLAYVYRHHLGGNSKESAAKHYQNLCREAPMQLDAAAQWLEAATYADAEMRLVAARHLLGLPPGRVHPDTWLRLCETKDEAIIATALPWIAASADLSPTPLTHSARIGDIIHELGMKSAALAWWRSRMDLDLHSAESAACVLRVASQLDPDKAKSLLQARFESESELHGRYAGEIANRAFLAGDIPAMEAVLKIYRSRTDQTPFKASGMDEWPARGWLEAARSAENWPEGRQAKVFGIIRDLKLGRVSAEAGMELVSQQARSLERLLHVQSLMLMADADHESWKRLYPFARAAVARDDHTLAAGVLNGLLNSIRAASEPEMAEARLLLRKAYAEMGSLSADIPSDSPLAPLLQIILHLRLGELELAELAYAANRELFDAHRAELPVELILFGAESDIAQGTAQDHERAEDILRGWLVKFGAAENIDVRDKARIQLLLATNYQQAGQFDVARAEFTTVINIYKDQPEALNARFGIGETYLAQKVYDQAGEIFTELAQSAVPAISVRAHFLLGVLALRQDQSDQARKIFLGVLEQAPGADLANETLFNLAEVYAVEQRFLAQLQTLRTVGRLGQEPKLWHAPGTALTLIVQDPDLGISQGESRVPVVIRSEPGNDREEAFLTSGGAGKAIFLNELPTTLGEAKPADGVLQLTGADSIIVDYPEDYKNKFQFKLPANPRLGIACDGELIAASSEIINQSDPSFTATLQAEIERPETPQSRSASRPENQIKPGNLIYFQVTDGDRDLTASPDKLSIKLTASSGDEVQVELEEQNAHGGVFRGTLGTGELPAGASASDSALDRSPLLAIDHDPKTSWRSLPDGAAPKSFSLDMKELRPVEAITLSSLDAEQEAPVRMRLRGSHDGRFWFNLGEFPAPPAITTGTFPTPQMRLRVYKTPLKDLRKSYTWEQLASLIAPLEPLENQPVDDFSWQPPKEGDDAHCLVWSGQFVQERDGAVRFGVSGSHTAILFDGRLELPPGEGGRSVDVFARRGVHELTIVSIATPGSARIEALRARENRQSSTITLLPFTAADFDLTAAKDLPRIGLLPALAIEQDANQWTLRMPSQDLRFIDFEFLEYRGQAVAVGNIEVSGAGSRHIPPAADVLELASNAILELAPGDTVQVSYLDAITAAGEHRNRLITRELTATYHNGQITPLRYSFSRTAAGSVQTERKQLMRIEPGERIVAEVVDFDLDVTPERDSVEIEVQVGSAPVVRFTATETAPSSGVFTAEIETTGQAKEGKILVKQGDKIFLRYLDKQNTFPGHAFHREALVYLNEPTVASVQIVESAKPPLGPLQMLALPVSASGEPGKVAKVDYRMPLTVVVIDPDQAKDSASTLNVEFTTTQGARARVKCVLSNAFASPDRLAADEAGDPALVAGRFVGQVPLVLGDVDSVSTLPAEADPVATLGTVLPPAETPNPEPAPGMLESAPPGLHMLNVVGSDTFTVRYEDQARPDGQPAAIEAKAALFSAATLRLTDAGYLQDAAIVHVGKKLFMVLEDPDRDLSAQRDKIMVRVRSASGEDETIELEETLTHSGIFSGSLPLQAAANPTPGNFTGQIECFFGDELIVTYLDNVAQGADGLPLIEIKIPVATGTDGQLSAFSKVYKDSALAVQTQFHIAESHFELFKGHRKLDHHDQAAAELQAGRRVLQELQEDFPDPQHAPRVAYLLGQFAQEMQTWDDAIAAYRIIVRDYPEHPLAPDAQYKVGQCHEEAGELDQALEAYVTLAATYPKNPLIGNVMLRICEHFYNLEDFTVAASVGSKFIERFPNHEWAPKMAFRIGQCHFKNEEFRSAGLAFDAFVKTFPEQELTSQALFWAGESYRMGKDIPNAFRRYNRCRWDFPESEPAKYSRGRLALPELLAEFDREADLNQ